MQSALIIICKVKHTYNNKSYHSITPFFKQKEKER